MSWNKIKLWGLVIGKPDGFHGLITTKNQVISARARIIEMGKEGEGN